MKDMLEVFKKLQGYTIEDVINSDLNEKDVYLVQLRNKELAIGSFDHDDPELSTGSDGTLYIETTIYFITKDENEVVMDNDIKRVLAKLTKKEDK